MMTRIAYSSAVCFPLLLLALLASAVFAASSITLVTLKTRDTVIQSYLLEHDEGQETDAIVMLFAGAGGYLNVQKEGDTVSVKNPGFVGRHYMLFARPKVALAVVEAPSDTKDMTVDFRRSQVHVADMVAVLRDLNSRFSRAKVYLVGHSRGTVSAAYVGQAFGDRISGIVLMAGFYERDAKLGAGLSEFNFDSLKVPVLLVHHARDNCPVTPYDHAKKHSTRFPLISVDEIGRTELGPPCGPNSVHGFLGREEQTVDEIYNWILGRAWKREIN